MKALWPLVFLSLLLPSSENDGSAPERMKQRLLEQINRDRAAEGRAAVAYSEPLSRAADLHCREMLEQDYMSHWNIAGWKPYLRYSAAGVTDSTQENVSSLWSTHFDRDESQVWNSLLAAHRSFLAERPPNDGHRRSILEPRHTHAGIGIAFDDHGMRLVEVFGARYAELEPLPMRATLRDALMMRGRVLNLSHELMGVGVYYEPLPRPMSRADLKLTGSYSLPNEDQMERPELSQGMYSDGSVGTVQVDRFGKFSARISFWKSKPGVYTAVVWLRERGRREGFMGASWSVIVEERKSSELFNPFLRVPGGAWPPPAAR